MKIASILGSLFFPAFLALTAQNHTVAAGGNAQGSAGSSSFSIGQVFYERPVGGEFSTIQGLQQPIEIVVLDNTTFDADPLVKIYPNPVASGFYILLPQTDYEHSKFTMSDANGRIIRQGHISAQETFVAIDGLTRGVYLLQVYDSKKAYGYKIIKQ